MAKGVIQGWFISGKPATSIQRPFSTASSPSRPGTTMALQCFGGADAFALDPRQLGLAQGGGKMLPDAVRQKMEAAFRADFSQVRVHIGPQAERIGAIAFTLGSDIYFTPGRYQPDTAQGQQLLGHELAHVLQQRAGRVRNPFGSGVAIVQDKSLELEADRLGRAAATMPLPSASIQKPASMNIHAAAQSKTGSSAAGTRPFTVSAGKPLTPNSFGTAQLMQGAPTFKNKDRSRLIDRLMAEEMEYDQMKNDLISVFRKVQIWVGKKNRISKIKSEMGRDVFFYGKMKPPGLYDIFSKEYAHSTVAEELLSWNPEHESPGPTAALLMDFALAWKHQTVNADLGSGVKSVSMLDLFAHQYAESPFQKSGEGSRFRLG